MTKVQWVFIVTKDLLQPQNLLPLCLSCTDIRGENCILIIYIISLLCVFQIYSVLNNKNRTTISSSVNIYAINE